jgi:hypothetical protein
VDCIASERRAGANGTPPQAYRAKPAWSDKTAQHPYRQPVTGLFVALALAGVAYWQRGIAVEQRKLAERQAARSDARADLIESQNTVRAAPREALSRGRDAAAKLDALGSGDTALPLLDMILNTARELPPIKPYARYPLTPATVFARQPQPKGSEDMTINRRPAARPFTVVGTRDVTGIFDDNGRAVGLPFGSDEVDRSYTNDMAWLDEEHFIAATGGWRKVSADADFTLFNAALPIYRANGTLAQHLLAKHAFRITSVGVLENNGGDLESERSTPHF